MSMLASGAALGLSASTVVHAAGHGAASLWDAVVQGRTGLRRNDLSWCDLPCWIGEVPGVDDVVLPASLRGWDCRNHRLAWLALQDGMFRKAVDAAIARYGAHRWIDAGLIDAAVVGGVDSLCLSTLHGFHSLQLLSDDICRPFDAARSGVSIGEAAGFVLLDRAPAAVRYLGGGESSDAWHMSTPHPEGLGAQDAVRQALDATVLAPADIGYVNVHGTGTPANDRSEAAALAAVFGDRGVPVP